jgi:hypothetical protein
MKKKFDKYIAQSSKGQIVALTLAFVFLVVIGGFVGKTVASDDNDDNIKAFGRSATWGFMQCVDGGFVQATIENSTKTDGDKVTEPAPLSVILLSLGFWLGGMILVSFFTGVATDFLNARREKILAGKIDYAFGKKYVLIVGYDFQVKNLLHMLLGEKPDHDVVLVTDLSAEGIHEEILSEFSPRAARHLFLMRKDLASPDSYTKFTITGAAQIYLIGDEGSIGRDGKTLQVLEILAKKAISEPQGDRRRSVKVYMHIEDSILYSQVRAVKLPADELFLDGGIPVFDLEVYNYYESWAWECWGHRGAKDGAEGYLPIRHAKGSRHAELFVIGAGRMGRAIVSFAMPLMNYGEAGKHCKITVFDPDDLQKAFLPDRGTIDALPEIDVRFACMDGCSDEANAIMLEAVKRPETSVTVVVALSDPGTAVRAYSELSNQLRRENVSILVWQATHSNNCPNKAYLKMGGPDSVADKTQVRYFGMTDLLPWRDPARFEYGMAINYFYECWFPYGKEYPRSPKATSRDFLSAAKAMWNADAPTGSRCGEVVAGVVWGGTKRWKKWASVNSGDTFKEKSVLFDGVPYEKAAETVLKAEHNRWWTEKLLSGWTYDPKVVTGDESHADKPNMLHGDMVPSEMLSEGVKDKDKINIAAMAVYGFI